MILITEPDPRLRLKSDKVEDFSSLREDFAAMERMMAEHDGIGLAAPQVGILRRFLIVDAAAIAAREERPLVGPAIIRVVNPRIISSSKETDDYEEGCLSLPGIYAAVRRPRAIDVEYLDEGAVPHRISADGLLSRCLQHEIDHLDGRLFSDYLSPLKRALVNGKLKKMKSAGKI
jgi:peptide deformylase